MFGYDKCCLIGKKAYELVSQLDPNSNTYKTQKTVGLKDKNYSKTKMYLTHKNGDLVLTEWEHYKLFDRITKEIRYYNIATIVDTIAKKTIKANNRHVLMYRGDVEFDGNKRIIHWSDKAQLILGYTKKDVLGKVATIIISEKDINKVEGVWLELFNSKRNRIVNRNRTRCGRDKFIRWTNIPIMDDDGKLKKISSYIEEAEVAESA